MGTEASNVEHPSVNRFEVVDHTESGSGRVLVRFGVQVTVSTQDDGRTMKVLLTDREDDVDAAKAEWREKIGNDLKRLNAQLP